MRAPIFSTEVAHAVVKSIFCLTLLWGVPLSAGPPKVQLFEEVEKGFLIGGQLGATCDLAPPVDQLSFGFLAGLQLGYDITWIWRLKAGFTDHIFSARSKNPRNNQMYDMDFESRVAWAETSLALLATERFYLYLQAGGGYLFSDPKIIDGRQVSDDDFVILAGGGLEYYTTLRHFSFAIEAEAAILPTRGDIIISVFPVIRYTFGLGKVQVLKPQKDRDGDGITDDQDKCPDVFGVEEEKGCPEPDTDRDGVIDRLDQCPEVPGPQANNGCPERRDTDKDGIEDKVDRCPTEAGPAENEGCPEEDGDADGIPDRIDLCPTKAGVKKFDGCPSQSDIKIKVKSKAIELKETIHFETNKAIIKSDSFALLDQVAATLRQYPEIKKLEIQGHTDSVGPDEYNRDLSQRRSEAVVQYLINKKIDPERLAAHGYGETKPIASNNTEAGRAQNRRVEMIILERE